MSIKLVLLKSGETLISDVKEILSSSDEKLSKYLLKSPYKVVSQTPIMLTEQVDNDVQDVQISLSKWFILSQDTEIAIVQDWVVTITEPVESLKNLYEENVNG
jgi:hypothetical protein